MILRIGTARQQWANAGIELHLGRLDVEELYELGSRLLAQDASERANEEFLQNEVTRLEQELDDAQNDFERADLEEDVSRLETEAEKLEAENASLKKQLEEAERTIRGLRQSIVAAEGASA